MEKVFLRNDLILDQADNCYRILHMEQGQSKGLVVPKLGFAWLIILGHDLALPAKVSLERLFADFKIRPSVDSAPLRESTDLHQPEMRALEKKASAASLAVADRAFEHIEPLLANPSIFDPTARHSLLVERSKEAGGATPKTLLKHLRRWWQGGQTLDALRGTFDTRGASDGAWNRGRKRKARGDVSTSCDALLRPFELGEKDRELMRHFLKTHYIPEGSTFTLAATLSKLHREHYFFLDGNGKKCVRPPGECPSRRQLQYFLDTNFPLSVRLARGKGEKRFAQEDRSTEGSIQLECHGAGHIYEFDATIVDVVLVSAKDPRKIVGKPTLYLVIDRHSRLIVGWYLGFENACYTAAMQALLSIGQDKQQMCERLGIAYDPADWPAHGVLPQMFLADQGELISKEARRIARSLRSTFSNVPGLRPDWKPLVECGFKMLHQIIAAETPGYTPDAEARKRRAINVDKTASLNIHQLQTIIAAAIIASNKNMQTNYPLSQGQVADGVQPIPRDLFLHSIQRRMGSLDRMDYEKVREELLPRDKAVITGDGIKFKKLFYTCPEAKSQGWLLQGRKQRRPIEVAFDHRLVDEIILYSPNGSGETFVAQLTKDSGQFEGMSFKEVHQHFADVRELIADAEELKRQNMFDYHEVAQPIIDNAIRTTKAATKGVSRSSRRTDIKPARTEELRDERVSSAAISASTTSAEATATHVGEASNVVPINRPMQPGFKADVTQQGAASSAAPSAAPSDPQPKKLTQRIAEYRGRF